ncbi:MAG: adenylate/guanylate cyclase domain-containing protein [Spirochaetota bacterium]
MQQRTKRVFAVILFLDIVGFTTFSEKNDPEIVDDYLSFFFDFVSNQIKQNSGWVEKYIGDAICAIFSSSSSSYKDALNACNCAYNILKNVKIFNEENKFPFSIRIGIDSGIVTTTKREQYDVFVGQAINSASRIQSVAKPNSCYVSKTIVDRANSSFEFSEIGEFDLKGITDKIKIFSLNEKKNIYDLEKIRKFYFPRKEEIEIIKYLSNNKKVKIAIKGAQGSGKTLIAAKISEYLNKLYKLKAIYVYLNDWERSINELSQKINFVVDSFSNNKENLLDQLLIIDNLNCLNINKDIFDFISKICENYPLILVYTDDNFVIDNLETFLIKTDFAIFTIGKLSFQEFDEFLQSYFEKPVSVTFQLKLYDLSEGYIGRACTILSLLKNELSLNNEQIINTDFEEIFSRKEDLLEHCYRINGIDDKMQVLLSILAFSYQPLSYEVLKEISYKINYEFLEESIEISKNKGWLKFNEGFYKISNEYLRQFIINSTSKQLKKIIINMLLKISDNITEKLSYILMSDSEDLMLEDEDTFLTSCIVKLEIESIENKLFLIKKIIKKLDINFFNKLLKIILLDKNIIHYLFNILKKEELERIIKNCEDLNNIKQIKSILSIIYPDKPLEKNDFATITFDSSYSFYGYLIKLLLYPKSLIYNFEEYDNIINVIKPISEIKKDYNYIFYFPYYEKEGNDKEISSNIIKKLNDLFIEDLEFYEKIEQIYFNPIYISINKIQLFFVLIENISLLIYFKKKPINLINRMLKLCEKIVLELDIPLLTEYYYGLFFYANFILSNFQYYGIHKKMDFKLLPQLKQINEIIYHIFSFSYEHKDYIFLENKFLKTSVCNAVDLFLNPPYYIPIILSCWYLNIIKDEEDSDFISIKKEISSKLKNSKKLIDEYSLKNNQIKDFTKIALSFI